MKNWRRVVFFAVHCCSQVRYTSRINLFAKFRSLSLCDQIVEVFTKLVFIFAFSLLHFVGSNIEDNLGNLAILLFCIGEEGFHEVRRRREQLCHAAFVESRLRVETDDVFVQLFKIKEEVPIAHTSRNHYIIGNQPGSHRFELRSCKISKVEQT